ncbi:hypothetical protein GCM10017774_67400 [Lentzea cavernae]|uniref:MYXO-CTERM domain-containing protein n=1 Tax=Lentzea cavernae TaxID=2020703 RepID=A0ABQ3MNB5_9PSEU|nr:hypothetical protein GCM10017774_67400 [Lentzea cavernae]
MTADVHADRLTWWLLTSVFGLLAAIDVALAVTERAIWPYALAALLLAASAWSARQALRPFPSSGASGSTVARTGTPAPDRSRFSRLEV